MMVSSIVLLLLCYTTVTTSDSVQVTRARVQMAQSQSCYYQPHNRELVCQCRDDYSYLHLRLREFVVKARQEVMKTNSIKYTCYK